MLRSISFHPSGDFLLVGTQHPTLRLYDVNTFQCFVSCNPLDQHTDTISGVSYNPSANSYVTCSKDGSIKLWDGVSNRCVTTFEKAHDGAEVCSAIFSKNSKYILSSGKDSVVKLWEISTGRTLVKYTGEDDVYFTRDGDMLVDFRFIIYLGEHSDGTIQLTISVTHKGAPFNRPHRGRGTTAGQ